MLPKPVPEIQNSSRTNFGLCRSNHHLVTQLVITYIIHTYLNNIVEFGLQPSFLFRDVQIVGFNRGGHHHHHQNDYKNGYISFHLKVQGMIISRKKKTSNIVKKYRD
jgi:hypothetical protein